MSLMSLIETGGLPRGKPGRPMNHPYADQSISIEVGKGPDPAFLRCSLNECRTTITVV
jgi:hypothetical protein